MYLSRTNLKCGSLSKYCILKMLRIYKHLLFILKVVFKWFVKSLLPYGVFSFCSFCLIRFCSHSSLFVAHRWDTRLRCCSSLLRRRNSCPRSSCRSPTLPCCTRREERLEGSGGGGADRPRTAPLPSKTTQLPMTIRIGDACNPSRFLFCQIQTLFRVSFVHSSLCV